MAQPAKFDRQAKAIRIGDSGGFPRRLDAERFFSEPTNPLCVMGVGKSLLALRFSPSEWSPSFITTIGVDFRHRIVNVDGVRIRSMVWDSAGQEKFRTITRAYYRGSEGVLFVYDVSNYSSFEGIRKWLDYLHDNRGDLQHMSKVLVGNKTDAPNRVVSTEEGQRLAEELGAMFCETSAKSSDGVMAAFMMVARDLKRRFDENPPKVGGDDEHEYSTRS